MPNKKTNPKVLLVDRVARNLKERIAANIYAPETLIPSERELAHEFGVSRSTISSAIAILAKEGLAKQAQGRGTYVKAALERLPFGRVGVAYGFPSSQPNLRPETAMILRGIEHTLTRMGYPYTLVPVLREGNYYANPPMAHYVETATIHTLAERYGAIITVEFLDAPDKILALEEQKVPLVVANLEIDLPVTATYTNHVHTFRSAVDMLAVLGHRRIALLTRDSNQFFYGKALEGYRQGLAAAGIEYSDSMVVRCDEPCALSAYLAIAPLLQADRQPTAIIVARDIMAKGVCRAITEAKLEIGRDISVIGFDDISWETETPYLTTFREPTYEMGALAAEILADRLVHGQKPYEQRKIESSLILRRSVGPPPGAILSTNSKGREVVFHSEEQITPHPNAS